MIVASMSHQKENHKMQKKCRMRQSATVMYCIKILKTIDLFYCPIQVVEVLSLAQFVSIMISNRLGVWAFRLEFQLSGSSQACGRSFCCSAVPNVIESIMNNSSNCTKFFTWPFHKMCNNTTFCNTLTMFLMCEPTI